MKKNKRQKYLACLHEHVNGAWANPIKHLIILGLCEIMCQKHILYLQEKSRRQVEASNFLQHQNLTIKSCLSRKWTIYKKKDKFGF